MGISQKTETSCHNFSFFGRQDFQKRYFRKTRNCGSAFQFLAKCPYPIDASRALRRSLNPVSALLRNAEGFWPEANCLSFDFGRLQKALPYQLNRAALLRFLQSFHGSVEKGRFSAFFRFLKQKGGVVRNGPLLYFSRPPLLQKPENRGNLDQPQATVVFL
jgi:hypothetical protein